MKEATVMTTPAVARHGQPKSRDANQWVVPLILAAWVVVLLCGYLVSSAG